ncbi:LOW QUALITY PROTEIN: hypothetical protein TorRG33x02_115610 [Trema orientale]|uniref:Uncharacterized protein n=1 Tax=Trema orientale TaxID=63057 RepID=A0A2P5F4H1_TREOI|nr:LOW QUALITY PROTEIN: hypothetical protein TorRG33x02_115610 [Trema orientale]
MAFDVKNNGFLMDLTNVWFSVNQNTKHIST